MEPATLKIGHICIYLHDLEVHMDISVEEGASLSVDDIADLVRQSLNQVFEEQTSADIRPASVQRLH